MNFDFSEDQKLLQKTVNEYLQDHAPLSVARQVLESRARYSETLWKGANRHVERFRFSRFRLFGHLRRQR